MAAIAPNRARNTNTTVDLDAVDALPVAATSTSAAAPTCTDSEMWLRIAAELGDVSTIDALINAGVDPSASNCADNTALHYAAWRGHTNAIQALLVASADPHARNCYGATPFEFAVREGNRQPAEQLRPSSD